eukprot:gene19220-13889_t
MAHYLGYRTVQYPKDPLRGDLLVTPDEEMRRVFTDSAVESAQGVSDVGTRSDGEERAAGGCREG